MLQGKVQRLTVLYSSLEELRTNVSQNDTCLTLKGGENVFVQNRTRLVTNGRGHNNRTRITWRSPYSVDKNGQLQKRNVLQPVLSPGFNIYTQDQTVIDILQAEDVSLGPPVVTPKYTVFHSLEIPTGTVLEKLFVIFGKSVADLKFNWASDVQYDIEITNDQLQIDEYRYLSNEETLTVSKGNDVSKLEVGFFYPNIQDESDVNLSGFRCLWKKQADNNNNNNNSNSSSCASEIDKCIKTSLFYKPAFTSWDWNSNHNSELQIPINLVTPIGMHPKVQIDLRNVIMPPLTNYDTSNDNSQCEFYLFAQLPLEIFVDKFQSHPVFVIGEHDLELPEYKLRDKSWGSEVLFNLQSGQPNEITLHSRYLAPATRVESPYGTTSFFPQVFMACDSDTEDVVHNPFYSKGFGFESYFTDNTVFYPLNITRLEVHIPRAEAENYRTIQLTTLLVIVLSFVYLLLRLFKTSSTKPQVVNSEKKTQ